MFGGALGQFWGRLSTLELFFWRNRLSAADTSFVTLILIVGSNYWHLSQVKFVPRFTMPLGAQIATGLVGWIICAVFPRLKLKPAQYLKEFIGLSANLVCLSIIVAVTITFIVERTGTYDGFVDLWDMTGISFQIGEWVLVYIFVAIGAASILANSIRVNPAWKNYISQLDVIIILSIVLLMCGVNVHVILY